MACNTGDIWTVFTQFATHISELFIPRQGTYMYICVLQARCFRRWLNNVLYAKARNLHVYLCFTGEVFQKMAQHCALCQGKEPTCISMFYRRGVSEDGSTMCSVPRQGTYMSICVLQARCFRRWLNNVLYAKARNLQIMQAAGRVSPISYVVMLRK